MAKITIHGRQRVKDRIGLSKKQSNYIADKALMYGISHSEAKGSLKKYFDYLYFRSNSANNIRIYNEKVFIFCNNTLITVLDLPNNFKRQVHSINNKKKNQ